ncbi:hypothetical protein ACE1CI_04390 [Aerosakkonemataceae cyanobacterium BLCC-F50]|uniref:Uncharacterized protein n=1 Tax=Floridaenema flaviceps BLCC-F50 TaxID=3153642 RepID=A0ABV4XKC3_9CYAN
MNDTYLVRAGFAQKLALVPRLNPVGTRGNEGNLGKYVNEDA